MSGDRPSSRRWPQCPEAMAEDRGMAAPVLHVPRISPPEQGRLELTPRVPSDVRFVTEESFDFSMLSPSDRCGGVAGTGHPMDENGGTGYLIVGDIGNRMGHER